MSMHVIDPPSSPHHNTQFQQHHHLSSHMPPSTNSNNHHQVPFGSLPGSQPGSLSYGFGLSAASNMASTSTSASTSWGGPPQQQPASAFGRTPSSVGFGAWAHAHAHAHAHAQAASSSTTSSPILARPPTPNRHIASPISTSNRRRRRSESLVEDDDEQPDSSMDSSLRSPRPMASQRGTKKARVASSFNSGLVTAEPSQADLGKALASLSKDSLLTLINKLVTTSPQLRPAIEALLPPPTLAHSIETINLLERSVVGALPNGHNLREEYIFGRVRVPLEEYVSEVKSLLSAFCSSTLVSSAGGEDEIGHPSTTFAFLHALTSSLRRLELALPPTRSQALSTTTSPLNPIASHLLPLTLNQWHIWLTKLSTSVNHEGCMISASNLRNWFTRLDEVCVESPGVNGIGGRGEGVAKKAMEGVRERLRREMGWVIGIRAESVGAGQGMEGQVDEDEEL